MRDINRSGIFFSVVVPVYQVEDYLAESIESVIGQSFREYEIILVDDGSTDQSGRICDRYAGQYEFIKVIHQSNQGLSAARNKGIRESHGVYIVFLDSDDRLCENALAELEVCIRTNLCPDVVAHRMVAFDCNGNEQIYPYLYKNYIGGFRTNAEAFNKFQHMPQGNMGAWNFTVRRDYVNRNELFFFEGIYHEDEEWVPRILLRNGTICFSDIVFYAYRIDRNHSITNSLNIQKLFDKLTVIERLEEVFASSDCETLGSIENRCCSILFGMLCELDKCRNDDRYYELLAKLETRSELLKRSAKLIHRLTYIAIRLAGVKRTAYILAVVRSRKKSL